LRGTVEPARLVGAEPVLAVQHNREHPTGTRMSQRRRRYRDEDRAGRLVRGDGQAAEALPGSVDEHRIGEPLYLDAARPGRVRGELVVALRERRRGREGTGGRIAYEHVQQLRTER